MVAVQSVMWIGGPSGAGKSTVARLVARRHGLRCHSTDTATWDHRTRALAAGDPSAVRWQSLTQQQRDVLTPTEQVNLDVDRASFVLADVEQLPDRPPTIVEGTEIDPWSLPSACTAVWLTAEPGVRARRVTNRGWGAAGGEADLIRAAELDHAIEQSGRAMIDTTAHTTTADTVRALENFAADWLATHPGVATEDGRRQLRRELNLTLVEQHRAGWRYHSRDPDPTVVRPLECECSDASCTAFVDRPIATLPQPFDQAVPPILADTHAGRSVAS